MKYFFLLLGVTCFSFSHQGKLDSHGGHTNKATGEYHYHIERKGKNINPFHAPIQIQILKNGYPSGWGQSFSSKKRCESARMNLIRKNLLTDYTYVCVRR